MEQITLDLLHVAMNISQAQHKVASNNIAIANTQNGQKLEVNFANLLSSMENVSNEGKSLLLQEVKGNWKAIESQSIFAIDSEIKLDEETANVLLSSGKYKLLAEGISRKFGLMRLAVSGGRG